MRLTGFIIADDIRFEMGNKLSIIGCYGEEMTLNLPEQLSWPIPFRFGVFIRIKREVADPAPLKFLLDVSKNNESVAKAEGHFNELLASSSQITIPIVLSPFPLLGYGLYLFSFNVYGDNDAILLSETQQIELIKQQIPVTVI